MVAQGPLYRWVLFGLPCVTLRGVFPDELVVKVRRICTHTKSVILAFPDKSGDPASRACPSAWPQRAGAAPLHGARALSFATVPTTSPWLPASVRGLARWSFLRQ